MLTQRQLTAVKLPHEWSSNHHRQHQPRKPLGEKGAFPHSQETKILQLCFSQRCSGSQVPKHNLLHAWHLCPERIPREGAHKAIVHKPTCTHRHRRQALRRGVRKARFRHSQALSLGLDLAGAQSVQMTAFDPPPFSENVWGFLFS